MKSPLEPALGPEADVASAAPTYERTPGGIVANLTTTVISRASPRHWGVGFSPFNKSIHANTAKSALQPVCSTLNLHTPHVRIGATAQHPWRGAIGVGNADGLDVGCSALAAGARDTH